jgi:hypothetical protein
MLNLYEHNLFISGTHFILIKIMQILEFSQIETADVDIVEYIYIQLYY